MCSSTVPAASSSRVRGSHYAEPADRDPSRRTQRRSGRPLRAPSAVWSQNRSCRAENRRQGSFLQRRVSPSSSWSSVISVTRVLQPKLTKRSSVTTRKSDRPLQRLLDSARPVSFAPDKATPHDGIRPAAVVNLRKCQEATALVRALRRARQTPQGCPVKVAPQSYRGTNDYLLQNRGPLIQTFAALEIPKLIPSPLGSDSGWGFPRWQ